MTAKTPTIYLDYAAATPLDDEVVTAMQPFFTAEFYNPSAAYAAARKTRRSLEDARSGVAAAVGSLPAEIVFTAGGTEANNLAIHGIMSQYPEANIVVSGVEHESVLAPADRYSCRIAAVRPDGTIDVASLQEQIDERTVLVSIMYANNEVGTVQPLREVRRLVAEKRAERNSSGSKSLPLYLHTDACQAANYLDIHAARLGVDLMTLNGGKLYGPKQSGALYVKRGVTLRPLIDGGGQERGLRSGTENVAGAVGLAVALTKAQAMRHEEAGRLQALQQRFLGLLEARLPSAVINGPHKHRLPNNLHLTIPGQSNERLLIKLDEAGIQAAAGSACSASDDTPSHVLRAMGLSDDEARSSLRLTMGRGTTAADIERTIAVLIQLVQP